MNFSKFLKILLATAFIGVGIGMILSANIGSDSISVLQDGLHRTLKISYGQASLLYNVVLLTLAFLFAKHYLGAGTVISALSTGFFIDISIFFIEIIINTFSKTVILQVILFVFGLIFYCFGLSILIGCHLGMNSLDSILTVLTEKTSFSYKQLRMLADLILTLCGWLMKGVVGAGTVISIAFTGILIQNFSKILQKSKENH